MVYKLPEKQSKLTGLAIVTSLIINSLQDKYTLSLLKLYQFITEIYDKITNV